MEAQHANLTRPQRFSVWLISHLPAVIVRDTERVMLAVCLAIVGFTSGLALLEPGGSITRLMPLWMVIEWALTLFLGGILTVVGMTAAWRATERAGLSLLGLGSFTYAMALIANGSPRGLIFSTVFLGFALCFLIRICSSSAAAAIQDHIKGTE